MSPSKLNEELLKFLYQVPVAIIEIDNEGAVQMINPTAVQILLPICQQSSVENLFQSVASYFPDLEEQFSKARPNEFVEKSRVFYVTEPVDQYLSFTLQRITDELGVCILEDVDQREKLRISVESEKSARIRAIGRAEMSSHILHDIGNAITAVGTSVSGMSTESQWKEVELIRKTSAFLGEFNLEIESVIGAKKAGALMRLLSEIGNALEERKERLEDKALAMNQGVSHINDILAIHRSQNGFGGMEYSNVCDLRHILRVSVNMLKDYLNSKEVDLSLDLGDASIPVKMDETQIIQVIVNLIRNATEAIMRANQGRRHITISNELSETFVTTIIADNGCGFGEEIGNEVFKDGFSRKNLGTGIGLNHCRSIAEAHSGSLKLESSGHGCGAEAHLRLPLHFRKD